MILDYWTTVGLVGIGLSLIGWLALWLTRPHGDGHKVAE
jgi:hypothetical protein